MLDISIGTAFLAGVLSFISPCVLPLVLPYLAYLAGESFSEITAEDKKPGTSGRVFWVSVFFVLGFLTIFVALGATSSVIGQTLIRYFDKLAIVAGLIIIAMGVHFLGLVRIPILYREARFQAGGKPAGLVSAYIMGLAFAFGWTPCVGPVLATILFLAGAEGSAARGALLLGVYSLGMGIPFLIAGLFAERFAKWADRFKKHLETVEKVMGGLLVITGILFMTGSISTIAQWLIDTFPVFQMIG